MSMLARLVFFLFAMPIVGKAQEIQILTKGQPVSIRGLSVVDNKIIWVSGSKGQVGRSTDGGLTWKWQTVRGFEQTDFRDIEAFDEKTAVIMGISEPAYILKTFNGGESWKLVYSDSTKGVFLDAMEFWDDGRGLVIGDPIRGRLYMARTSDHGNHWQKMDSTRLPQLAEGEAFFASSGTNLRTMNFKEAIIVSGGKSSRVYARGRATELPLLQGSESTGANSVAVSYKNNKADMIVVVGGDFTKDSARSGNCVLSSDQGRTWTIPSIAPFGYRSCVEFIGPNSLIACGTNGVDFSADNGKTWKQLSTEGFHVCKKARNGKSVFLAGSQGRIAVLR
jgi:photosystem II stability/assembly factor-like uncharacterized protein